MAGNQVAGDNLTSQMAGMSKTQLYDIMSQMKNLIEQNPQQARQILVENPLLTKALFQAQIMLGMVQPPQVMPSIQQTLSQPQQQTIQRSQLSSVQAAAQPSVQPGRHGQASSAQPQNLSRQQHATHPLTSLPTSSPPIPAVTLPSQTDLQQSRLQIHAHTTSIPSHPSQIHNPPSLPLHSAIPQPSVLQAPLVSSQGQQFLQTPGMLHQQLQPALPLQPRQPALQPFPHQLHNQMGASPFLTSQQTLSHSMFPLGSTLQAGSGSFPQGQPPLPGHLPPQQVYQGGANYKSSQGVNSTQIERGTSWMSGPDNAGVGARLPGPPPFVPLQMGSSVPVARSGQLAPEVEKQLLEQVMSLKPDQINLLPPEQRQQVLQLQQMLR